MACAEPKEELFSQCDESSSRKFTGRLRRVTRLYVVENRKSVRLFYVHLTEVLEVLTEALVSSSIGFFQLFGKGIIRFVEHLLLLLMNTMEGRDIGR